MSDGIEKLQKYAFGMNPRRCDDILLLADQIKREHVSELQAIEAEIDKRLMPPGMEWPRFEDGDKITCDDAPEDITAVCIALDGSCYALHYDMPDDERMCIYEVSERVKRPEPDVLAADGLPIKVGETVYLTDDNVPFEVQSVRDGAAKDEFGEWYDSCLLTHTQPITQSGIDKYVDDALRCAALMMISEDAAKSLEDRVKEALRCQRELCANGGE